jgi:hypothetical protein
MNIVERSVTEYCERVDNSIFGEPINLLTNLTFIISACFVFRLLKEKKVQDNTYKFLIGIILMIGVGSASWHSFRTSLAHALDFVPIFIFFLSFLFLMLEKLLKSKSQAILLTSTYFVLQLSVSFLFPQILNGSIRHIVNIGIFILLILWIKKKYRRLNSSVYLAFGTYSVGVLFRSMDSLVCSNFHLGTHFLWHIFTAMATYYSVASLIWLKKQAL